MNSLARRSLFCVLLCACTGGPISDYPRPVTDDGSNSGDGDGLSGGDGDRGDGDGDGDESPASGHDAGVDHEPDVDAGLPGPDAGDAGGVTGDDGGVEDAGPGPIGTLSGDLGVLDTELTSADPALFVNHFDLGTLDPTELSEEDLARLTPGAQRMLEEGGLFTSFRKLTSYEVLARSEGAELLKLGDEIAYDSNGGEKADYLVRIDGTEIGVTVARARSYPADADYTLEAATSLLEDRLQAIAEANENVSTEDQWQKQILHILAYSDAHATVLQSAYTALDAQTKGNTIVIITITDGDDALLY